MLLNDINNSAAKAGKLFLVIGGLAVLARGHSRLTGDVDLLVPKGERQFWIELIMSLGYSVSQNHEVFVRFSFKNDTSWPVDLMFVRDEIFEVMLTESDSAEIGGVAVKVPSVKHLISLKLHALKQRQEHREDRDFADLKYLASLNNVEKHELRQLCEKYGRIDLYERINAKD